MSSSLAAAASTGELDLNTFHVPCGNISEFKEALKILRDVDDRIVYRLNTSIPTASFAKGIDTTAKCKELHDNIQEVFEARGKAIAKCIDETSRIIVGLREQHQQIPDSSRYKFQLHQANTKLVITGETKQSELRTVFVMDEMKLRMMQSELTVEEIVHDRTMKAFRERCLSYKDA